MSTAHATSDTSSMGGEVIQPGDPGYDEARALYNAMIDKHPAAIARCRSAADVAATLESARRAGLAVAVRGGGHSGPGFGTVDGGVVIDLSPMNLVEVDADARTARVQGGATWGAGRRRHPRPRPGHPGRHHRQHRGRWAHPRRRARLPVPQARSDDRQPDRGRGRARRRPSGDRIGVPAPGSVLGAARRRRQLRRGHLVHLPAAPRAQRHLRAHRLAGVGHRRRAELVPRLHSRPGRGPVRLLRHHDGPACRSLPGGVPPAEGVLGRLVLHRRSGPGRRGVRSGRARLQPAFEGLGEAPYPGAAVHLRRSVPHRAAVVLAR